MTTQVESRCGTRNGYEDHLAAGTPPCEPCRAANTAYAREWRKRNGKAQQRAKKLIRAQSRAVWRLAAIYGDAFDALVKEEMAKEEAADEHR